MPRTKIRLLRFILIISCFLLSRTSCERVGLSEEFQELADSLHETCQEETKVDEGVISDAKDGVFAEDEKLKCYIMCVMTELAVMDDDGMVDVEAGIALMPDDRRPHVAGTIRFCGTQIGENHCDNAYKTYKCYFEQNEKYYYLP